MKKAMILSTVAALMLQAASINFKEAPKDFKRVMPSGDKNVVLSFYDAIKEAKQSVVNISTKKVLRTHMSMSPFFNDPFFRQFFGPMFRDIPRERIERALGSGVIISKDGYIVTNNHVVKDADEVTVSLPGSKKEYKAKVVGKDPLTDIAVVKIDAKNLKAIAFGDSSKLKTGDIVFAIGNPFGIGETVTQGIVSGLNRKNVGINTYENFIQTDAAINPGNSGGALVDSRGALIGINSAIITRSGGNNGIGFAIPVNMVKDVVKKLIEKGKIERGYLGVVIEDLKGSLKDVYAHKYGAVIVSVEKDSAASKAGLKRGDLIIEVDGKRVEDADELKTIIGSKAPGEKVKIRYERDKRVYTTYVKLKERPGSFVNTQKEALGLSLRELDNQTRQMYHIPSSVNGLLVVDVKPNSKADKAGFRVGDVIEAVEDMDIKNIQDFKEALRKYKGPKRVYVLRRGGYPLILVLK